MKKKLYTLLFAAIFYSYATAYVIHYHMEAWWAIPTVLWGALGGCFCFAAIVALLLDGDWS